MKPFINEVDLTGLPIQQRKKICDCNKPCDKGVSMTTYKDALILCWVQARKTLYDMISVLDDNARTSWTEKDEELLIEHYTKHGVYSGINTDVATLLGKSRAQVKSKVERLRKAGRL